MNNILNLAYQILSWKVHIALIKAKLDPLGKEKSKDLLNRLNEHFEKRVAIPRIRRGEYQEIETLIGEEALLFAKYLRNEKQTWHPRTVELSQRCFDEYKLLDRKNNGLFSPT